MGETRVDLRHLLEDLRDAYPGALEETILPEVVSRARSAYVGFNSGSYRQALVTPLRKLSGTDRWLTPSRIPRDVGHRFR